ncbi:MAG: glycoside hydrolase family 2, partial [Erysipelotrichaceae bacterium]|nr:glycoside hydrolase family 2 [Erysipelotrichaceae bacterium]
MFTSEGKKLDPSHPLEEYPTPQFQRDSYFCLNGEWDFQLDEDKGNHSNYTQKIIVPFAVETPLSQIGCPVKKGQIMHYRKMFRLPFGFKKGRVLLHFEAVDQICDVFLNGVKIAHHEGGYLPFTVDCLELRQGDNELLVDVTDDTTSPDFPRGKQATKSSGIWYTATSGIWGTVWLESVPNEVIQSLRITPLFDEKKVHVATRFEGKVLRSKVEVFYGGRPVASATLDDDASCTIDLSAAFHPWSPDVPNLYDLRVSINFDVINSYFAMRKFSST